MFAPTVQPVQMNLQMVCRGRTSGHLLLRICRNSPWHTLRNSLCTPKNIPGVDHSWSIFRTIRGMDENEKPRHSPAIPQQQGLFPCPSFFLARKTRFLVRKTAFLVWKIHRAEKSRGQNRRAEKSIAENSRAETKLRMENDSD